MQYESQYYGVVDFNGPYLMHHGIKGQKWGVRRYQNPDGSLTAAGKKRYYTSDGSLTKRGERSFNRDAAKLQKLKDRTNIELQKQKAEQYNKRASVAGKVALGAAGAAAAGGPLNATMDRALSRLNAREWRKAIDNARAAYGWKLEDNLDWYIKTLENKVPEMNPGDHREHYNAMDHKAWERYKENERIADSNYNWGSNKINSLVKDVNMARAVTAGAAGVSAGVYAYNKIQARLATKRTTDLGHEKAVQAYKAQEQKMLKLYGTTKMSELKKKQN